MKLNPFAPLMDEAQREAYVYFDRHVRTLPKKPNGEINGKAPGLDDNDVDAFRHAYVSGVFTQVYGEKAADLLGMLNEYSPEVQYSHAHSPRSRNMDLWNNKVGRKYGKRTRGRKRLLRLIHEALKRGELIVDLKDSREYAGAKVLPRRLAKPIISVSKARSGRNQTFFDLVKCVVLSRVELVARIQAGEYRGYSVKVIRGVETPVSKRDCRITNNIG